MTEGRAGAPASSANLGPGFDTIALALDLHCFVVAEPAETWSVTHIGSETFDGDAADDAVVVAAKTVSRQPLRLTVENHIPLSRGLGSSAAAFTAGALAAMRANGQDPDHDELFGVVRDLEGHPDNAAAAVYGGLVAVSHAEVVRLSLADSLNAVLAVPNFGLRTKEARQVLPEAYEMAVVSRTLGRFAGLLLGLQSGDKETLALARGDELHEGPRAGLNSMVPRLIEVGRQAGAFHACWSGAGPSVMCFVDDEAEGAVIDALEAVLAGEGTVYVLDPDTRGAI